jgi:NAD(P)-dependent dehydrogenase (short-subunit alcohol dehydrogenase family)
LDLGLAHRCAIVTGSSQGIGLAMPDTPMPHYAASNAALANFTKALSRVRT